MTMEIVALGQMLRTDGQHPEADRLEQADAGRAEPGLAAELVDELRTYRSATAGMPIVRGQLTGDEAMLGSLTGRATVHHPSVSGKRYIAPI